MDARNRIEFKRSKNGGLQIILRSQGIETIHTHTRARTNAQTHTHLYYDRRETYTLTRLRCDSRDYDSRDYDSRDYDSRNYDSCNMTVVVRTAVIMTLFGRPWL